MVSAIDVASWLVKHSKYMKTHRQVHKLTWIHAGYEK